MIETCEIYVPPLCALGAVCLTQSLAESPAASLGGGTAEDDSASHELHVRRPVHGIGHNNTPIARLVPAAMPGCGEATSQGLA